MAYFVLCESHINFKNKVLWLDTTGLTFGPAIYNVNFGKLLKLSTQLSESTQKLYETLYLQQLIQIHIIRKLKLPFSIPIVFLYRLLRL